MRFDAVCDSRLGKMLDAKQQTGQHQRPYLRNANVQWDRLDLTEVSEMDFDEVARGVLRLHYGDVLICEGGEAARSAVWRDELAECYFQKALHRARPKPEAATPEYIVYLMWSLVHSGASSLRNSVTSATIAHLTGVKLRRLRIACPPFALQRRFSEQVAEIRTIQSKQDRSRERLADLFQSLLHRAFQGEL